MKQLRQLNYLLAALSVLVFFSCGDDDDDEPSRRDLLTAATWQANRVFLDGQDVTSFLDVDQTNIKFDKDGTYTWEFDGDTIEGVWEFTDNEQKILLDKNTASEESITILDLTATTFNLQLEEVDSATGDNHTLEIRHTRE